MEIPLDRLQYVLPQPSNRNVCLSYRCVNVPFLHCSRLFSLPDWYEATKRAVDFDIRKSLESNIALSRGNSCVTTRHPVSQIVMSVRERMCVSECMLLGFIV